MKSFIAGVACISALTAASMATTLGETAEQTRDVGKFQEIHAKGFMDVSVEVGKAMSVRVEADADIIDKVITEVRNGTLVLSMEKGRYRHIDTLHVYVTTPSLESAVLAGSGFVEIEGLEDQDFSFSLTGSGDAEIEGNNLKEVSLSLRGSGDIEIEGDCSAVTVGLQGSGDVVADDLECATANVELRGSGDVEVFASQRAEVSLRGSGDVEISGEPDKVVSKVRGSGEVTIAD